MNLNEIIYPYEDKTFGTIYSENELFEMSNISPTYTGLPTMIYITPRPDEGKHDFVRIKFQDKNTKKYATLYFDTTKNEFVIFGKYSYSMKELDKLKKWYSINFKTLFNIWNRKNGYEDVSELGRNMKKV